MSYFFIVLAIEMDITKNTALIEALLLEEIPDCNEVVPNIVITQSS
jgi:hypothetical protein